MMKNLVLIALGVISAGSIYAFNLQTIAFNQSLGQNIYANVPVVHAEDTNVSGDSTMTGHVACAMPTHTPPTTVHQGSGDSSQSVVTPSSTVTPTPSNVPKVCAPVPCIIPVTAQSSDSKTSSGSVSTLPTQPHIDPKICKAPAQPVTGDTAHSTVPTSTTSSAVLPPSSANAVAAPTTSNTFSDGTLVKGSDRTVYLVFGGKKYGIPSVEVFNRLGLSFKNVKQEPDTTVSNLPTAGIQQ